MGGYIGLFLGYSFLQIPDFIILIVLRAKSWLQKIREGRGQNQTETLKVIVHEHMSISQGKPKRESNEDWEGNRLYVGINDYKELITRIEQLEKSVKSNQRNANYVNKTK